MNAFYHARSSARKWGGSPESYLKVHDFIDSSKSSVPDMRHRSMLHSSWGIWMVGQLLGPTITVERKHGRIEVPVREIAEQHVLEDLGRIPTMEDWLENMTLKPWMSGAQRRQVSTEEFLGVTVAAS